MLKAENINTIEDAQRFVEGCINDFEACIMTKDEYMTQMLLYTQRIQTISVSSRVKELETIVRTLTKNNNNFNKRRQRK